MASTREERMQQRLRGAQRREVKDVDFGLTFPAISDIPQPTQQAALSQSTPQQILRGLPGAIASESNPPTSRSTTNDANISAKRRKLNSDETHSSSVRTTQLSLHAETGDSHALPEEDGREQATANTGNAPTEDVVERDELEVPSQVPSQVIAQVSPVRASVTEVITESPVNAPGSGHRMHLSEASLQSLGLQDSLHSSSLTGVEHVNSSPAQKRRRRMGNATPVHSSPPAIQSTPDQTTQDDDDEVDELSPDQPRGRSRNPKKLAKDKPLGESANEEDLVQHSEEEAEEINDQEAAAILKNSRGRGRPSLPAAASPDLDEPTPPVASRKKRGKAAKVTTPAQQRQPKASAPQAKAKPVQKTSKKTTKPSKGRVGSPIPITVHRFTERPLYDDDDSEADILNSEIPHIKRAGVNAIDVLSQVCHEIIDSGLDTLVDGGRKADDPALRREYKTKWTAVDAFGRELQNRLLEHTINLDNSVALERRVREERKKRLGLREDILRIRAEREQIALRMDEIRIKHEAESKDAQERNDLNNNIYDIELALERGKQQHPDDSVDNSADMIGIELVLKRIASEVSNKSDSGGILKQVTEFNAFLERAALALEAKRG